MKVLSLLCRYLLSGLAVIACWSAAVGAPPARARAAAKTPTPALRTWSDVTGEHKIRATLVEVTEEAVQLREADGSTITVPLEKLSKADRVWLSRYGRAAAAAAGAGKSAGQDRPGSLGPGRDGKSLDTGLLTNPVAIRIVKDAPYGDEDLVVTKVYRISHPAYRAVASWYENRTPYNRDGARVLINEDSSFTHPTFKERGRGMVCGFVDKLKTWQTLEEYKAVAKPILATDNSSQIPNHSIFWSPLKGEENVLYGIDRSTKRVVRIDVDMQKKTEILSYDPADGTDVSKARAMGWTTDNHLVVNFGDESTDSAGFEANVVTKTRTRYAKWPAKWTAQWRRFPALGHGHGSRSPDGSKMVTGLATMQECGVINTFTGEMTRDTEYNRQHKPFPYCSNHGSWLASEKWFLVSPWKPGTFTAPHVEELPIWQCYYTDGKFKYRDLLMVNTARKYTETKDGKEVVHWPSWGALIYPVVRKDGKQFYFTVTDGKLDYAESWAGGSLSPDVGAVGAFVADMEIVPRKP